MVIARSKLKCTGKSSHYKLGESGHSVISTRRKEKRLTAPAVVVSTAPVPAAISCTLLSCEATVRNAAISFAKCQTQYGTLFSGSPRARHARDDQMLNQQGSRLKALDDLVAHNAFSMPTHTVNSANYREPTRCFKDHIGLVKHFLRLCLRAPALG